MDPALRISLTTVPPLPGNDLSPGGNSELWFSQLNDQKIVCKKYDEDYLGNVQIPALEFLVAYEQVWRASSVAVLNVTVWPRALLVEPAGPVCGVVMDPLPSSFLEVDDNSVQARTLDRLFFELSHARSVGARYFEPPERLRVLGETLRSMHVLHEANVAVNDMQPGNVAFTEDGDVKFLDCDSMHGPWGTPVGAIHPIDFAVRASRVDRNSDMQKFALVASNILQSVWGPVPLDRNALKRFMRPQHLDLLEDALNGVVRPALEWEQMAEQWRDGVASDGTMYVYTKNGGIETWLPEPEPEEAFDGEDDTHVKKKRTFRGLLVGAAALACLIALLVVLFLTGVLTWPPS